MALYRASFKGIAGTQEIVNVLGYQIADGTPGTELQAICDRMSQAWATNILPLLQSNYGYLGTDLAQLGSIQATRNSAVGAPAPGGQAGNPLPLFVSVGVELRTDFGGRSGRGRTGLGPIPELVTADTSGSGQGLTAGYRDAVDAGFRAFVAQAAIASAGAPSAALGVISQFANGVKRVQPVFNDVTSLSVATLVGTRLSRKTYA